MKLALTLYMRHRPKIQNMIRVLIKSRFYFDLPLRERHDFLNDLVRKHSASFKKPVSFRGKGLVLRTDL